MENKEFDERKEEEMNLIQIAGLITRIGIIILSLRKVGVSEETLSFLITGVEKISGELQSRGINLLFDDVIRGFDKPSKERS